MDDEYLLEDDGLTQEELKEQLPPYWFLNPKQKRKFFRKMDNKFKRETKQNKQKKIQKKRIFFKLKSN